MQVTNNWSWIDHLVIATRRTVGQNRVKVGQKSKLANVFFFLYLFRSLEKEHILKNMTLSNLYFLKEFKAVIYAHEYEKNMTFAQIMITVVTLKTAWWREDGESNEGFTARINYYYYMD